LGSDIIYDKMTLFLDIYYILARAEPEWFQEREVELSRIAGQGDNRALVVDDSSIFRQMISKYLTEFGFEISTADNGQTALEQAERQSFDLIISDIEMPVMDGLDFARALRKKSAYQSVPALALSSLNDEEIARMALDAGFDDYEVKLEKEHFLNKVNSLISQQAKKG
jgi:two-component system chemotaxis sensor kinase CheA